MRRRGEIERGGRKGGGEKKVRGREIGREEGEDELL